MTAGAFRSPSYRAASLPSGPYKCASRGPSGGAPGYTASEMKEMTETRWDEVPGVPVPPTLYKYCPPERIDILHDLKVRFSPPSEFNDTFDSRQLIPSTSGVQAKQERSKLRNRFGVLCLTEQSDDQLMWVNYAKNHTGFVIGFDARSPFFDEDGRLLRKVQYQSSPKVLPVPDISGCFYKASLWQHEREWRCVRVFEESEARLVPIDPMLITEIVIGHKMETWHIAQLAICVAGQGISRVKFFLSSPSNRSWRFEQKAISVSLCEACGGQGYKIADRG